MIESGQSMMVALVGFAAVVANSLQIMSGVPEALRAFRQGSMGSQSSSLPFSAGALNALCWVQYGRLIGDYPVALVNVLGFVAYSAYVLVHLRFAARSRPVALQILAVAVLFGLLSLTQRASSDPEAVCGAAACTMSALFCASPLLVLRKALVRWDNSGIPILLVSCTTVQTALWVLYGFLTENALITYLNLCCCLLASASVLAYLAIKHWSTLSGKQLSEGLLLPQHV